MPRKKTVDFRLLAEALRRVRTRLGGCRWKSQNRKNVFLSLCRRTFKLKGYKKVSFLNKEIISVFRVSRFLCSMYICYEHSMYVSHIRIWQWYIYILVWFRLVLWYIFFIMQRVKARAILCPHQPPTRGDNTVWVAQGGTAAPGATKQLLQPDRVYICLGWFHGISTIVGYSMPNPV